MGTLKKMNKANLMYEQEKNAELSEEVLSHLCTIIDAMTPVRKIKTAGLTYKEFSLNLLNAVMSSGCPSTRMDVVFDVYQEISINNFSNFKKFPADKTMNYFLSSANNKTKLIKFRVSEWKNNACLFFIKFITRRSRHPSYTACSRCISKLTGYYIIHTSDTDVFILAIAMWVIEAKIFIKTGNQSKLRLINGRWLMGSIIKIKLAHAKHS